MDNTLLTIALPTIGRDLGSGTTGLQWVTGAYSLTFGGLLLTADWAADRLGVSLGVPADRTEDLTGDALDLPGAVLSVATIGLACYTLTSGVEHGWLSVTIAMAGVMFGLILHFQYAYGWRPMRAGLASLPLILTMIAATPISESLARRLGHRVACLIGAVLLAGSLAGLAWGVDRGYPTIAACMVVLTIGRRTVMTICAVALVSAMPSNRTSIGAALNDTAQEIGSSVGTAVVGTLIAALVTVTLPAGRWSSDLVVHFFHGERVTYATLAVLVGLVADWGALTLTDSRSTDELP